MDEVIGVVKATSYEAENFKKEATLQNKMLDRLNEDIDVANDNMIRVEGRMKNLLKKSRLCCLMSVLLIEFVVLLVLIFFSFFS